MRHERDMTMILSDYRKLMVQVVAMGKAFPDLKDEMVKIHAEVLEEAYAKGTDKRPDAIDGGPRTEKKVEPPPRPRGSNIKEI